MADQALITWPNRFKGLDLIDRVPDELHDIVQDSGIKTIPKKKKCKKAKWLCEEALQIAEKRREVKDKRGKGKIYPFECRVPKNSNKRRKPSSVINAKKEENNRMRKTRYLF